MWRNARYRARIAGIPFDIDVEDVVIPTHCPILGIPLFVNPNGRYSTPNSPSLDRINNELGYIKGNVWVISMLANDMKSSANREQMLTFSGWVMDTYGNERKSEENH